jgi:type IV pilus assembly protein PilY1
MNTPRNLAKKTLIGYLIYALGFSPLMGPAAHAASVDYSDVPLPAKQRPNPNMILSIDDSGSMDGEVAIDANDGAAWYYTAGLTIGSNPVDGKSRPGFHGLNQNDRQDNVSNPPNFNQAGNANGTWKKYVYLFPNGHCGANCATRAYRDDQNDHFAISPSQQFGFYRSPDFNKQYYNPTIVYQPWKPYGAETAGEQSCISGTITGGGATWLCTPGNADPQGAWSHPIYGGDKINLTGDVSDNTNAGYYFRLYDGMRVLPEAKYRRCRGAADNDNCEGWQTAPVGSLLCVGGNNANAKAVCDLGTTTTGNIDMQGATWDHVDMAPKYFPARYFISQSSTKVDPALYASYPVMAGAGPGGEKMFMVEIRPSNNSYPKAVSRTDCAGATCTYTEEMQNFANWYQYYRKRHMSLNGALGNAFDGVRSLRGGHFLFNNPVNVTMYDFDAVGQFNKNERALLSKLYRVKGTGGTPTRESLQFLGEQFRRTGAGAPITAPCQFNGGFIITDGFASQGGPTGFGNADNVSPATNPFTKQFNEDPAVVIRDPYRDNWSDTLADMAMFYYSTNLRPDLQAGRVSVDPNDLSPDADKNTNLHMNTYGLVLGLSGMMFANPAFGPQNADPYTSFPNWNAVNPRDQQRSPTAIDELWHATINGRGQMLKADSPEETRNAVLDVVNNIVAKGGGAAAVSVSNAIPTAGDNFTYQTSYNAGAWSGDVNAFTIDIITGAVSGTPAWTLSAQKQLADRDWTSRVIVTYNPLASPSAKGVPFRWDDLNTGQQDSLKGLKVANTNVPGQWVVDWLRGDRSREGQFLRSRGPRKNPLTNQWKDGIIPNNVAVLGDLVNAEPIYVREPRFNYGDEGYAAFKAANNGRTRVLYVAGNDGMVHVFDGQTGAEKWAYMPSFGFTPQTGYTSAGLRNLADKEFFIHRFLADATPFHGDYDTVRAGTPTGTTPADGSSWRTMVVGGLGKGARGIYALNATNPDAANELGAASRVLWEFPNPSTSAADRAQIGYVYGRPVLAKTRALGWVVLVASGYENGDETGGDGVGILFVLNPNDGTVLARLRTVTALGSTEDGATSAANRRANPRGLSYISAFAGQPNEDATIDYVYGGDLYGNLWRFDLSKANVTDWTVKRLATLTDASNNRQPITSEPELGVVGGYRVVYVGTGRYFGDKDIPGVPGAFVSATGRQTLYALKDDQSDTPLITSPRSALVQQTVTKSAGFAQVSSNPVDFGTKSGWFMDLPDTGERVITNPTLAGGVLSITSNIPDGTDPCLPGGRSWLYILDYRTGGIIPGATYAGKFIGDALASRVNVVRVGSGIKGLIRTSAGETKVEGAVQPPGLLGPKRKAWREILD